VTIENDEIIVAIKNGDQRYSRLHPLQRALNVAVLQTLYWRSYQDQGQLWKYEYDDVEDGVDKVRGCGPKLRTEEVS